MAKRNEISSTEKLLELIRSNSRSNLETTETSKSSSLIQRFKSIFQSSLTLKKGTTVGVDVGYNDLKLVKIKSTSGEKHELIDYLRVPFEPDVTVDHPDFPKFLKQTLFRFCGSAKHAEIWSIISSARVELRYLSIPKVPQKQIANAVYWSHKKIAPYNEEEAIFDFEVLGDIVEDGTAKIAVVSFTAPRQDIEKFKSLFAKSGYPLKGISIVPFAFQNLFKSGWIQPEVKSVSSLYIGRDWSRIDIFSGGRLVLSRGIKAGIKTMNAAMRGEITESENETIIELPPEAFEIPQGPPPESDREQQTMDTGKAEQIFFGLIHDISAGTETRRTLQPEEEEIFKMILPALERLVQQVERTFEHYTAHFENQRVGKIYISSGIRPHRRIVDYIGDELGLPRETFDPFTTDAQYLGNVSGPASDAERGSYAPAMGMALSKNSLTPNFLFNYKDKAKAGRSRLLNKFSMVAFFVLIAGCLGFYFWQGYSIDSKKDTISNLKLRLNRYGATVDQKVILNLVDQTKTKKEEFSEFGKKYIGIVVLSEISNMTPSNIRLTSISVQLGGAPGAEDKNLEKNLILEGIVLGNRVAMEASLAGYLLKLSDSLLFDQPLIREKEMGFFNDKEVLRFSAQLTLA